MREGSLSSPPFISQQSVRQALDSLLFTSKVRTVNPLSYLTLVDHILSDPAFPKMDRPREMAVHHLLVDIITNQLALLRKGVNLDMPSLTETRTEAKTAIERDAHQQFPELSGWSMLYYRYIRVDLNIAPQEYHKFANVDSRTNRRYQELAVKRLAQVIADREWAIRQKFRQLRLVATIPGSDNEVLFGRHELTDHVQHIIKHDSPPHVQFTGPGGIGKTSLARHVVRGLAEENLLDQIVWITQPRSVRYIQQQLRESLIQEQNLSLTEYTLLYQCAIVLDDLSLLGEDIATLPKLVQQIGNAYLLVTNPFAVPLGDSVKHIVVPELSKQAVEQLVRRTRPHIDDELNNYTQNLLDRVGGNPAAIRAVVNSLANLNLALPLLGDSVSLHQQMFTHGYESLNQEAQRCFLAYMLLPSDTFTLLEVCNLWPEYQIAVQESLLVDILSCGLITKGESDSYFRPDAVQRFAHGLYSEDNAALEYTILLIDALESSTSPLAAELIENALLRGLSVDSGRVLRWISRACYDGVAQGRYARWLAIFEAVDHLPGELTVVYAACLRRLADFDRAEDILYEIINTLGEIGDFLTQARGLIELGTLFRQQGLYEQAVTMFEKARTIAVIRNESELLLRCNVELAQIALDTDQIAVVSQWLASSDIESNIQAQILSIELLLSKGQLNRAQSLAEQTLDDTFRANRGRVYGLLGRIFAAKGDLDAARDRFDAAITLLEQEEDIFALARIQSNRAALNLNHGVFLDEAKMLLDQAAVIQRYLKDRAGLLFTLQNQRILRRMMSTGMD